MQFFPIVFHSLHKLTIWVKVDRMSVELGSLWVFVGEGCTPHVSVLSVNPGQLSEALPGEITDKRASNILRFGPVNLNMIEQKTVCIKNNRYILLR